MQRVSINDVTFPIVPLQYLLIDTITNNADCKYLGVVFSVAFYCAYLSILPRILTMQGGVCSNAVAF